MSKAKYEGEPILIEYMVVAKMTCKNCRTDTSIINGYWSPRVYMEETREELEEIAKRLGWYFDRLSPLCPDCKIKA